MYFTVYQKTHVSYCDREYCRRQTNKGSAAASEVPNPFREFKNERSRSEKNPRKVRYAAAAPQNTVYSNPHPADYTSILNAIF